MLVFGAEEMTGLRMKAKESGWRLLGGLSGGLDEAGGVAWMKAEEPRWSGGSRRNIGWPG